jgi:hypothetical protein
MVKQPRPTTCLTRGALQCLTSRLRRFDDFVGVGQKAAMAVEILERDLGVSVRNLERSDIAYDVHIRRVFLRTRLAERDDRDHIIAVARQLHPARPGGLDLPCSVPELVQST